MPPLIDPVTATLALRPEFEAALHSPPPPTCPHRRQEAAARAVAEPSEAATPAAGPGPADACRRHRHRTVGRFPRHQHRAGLLPPRERAKLVRAAREIVRSYGPGCSPVRSVLLVGHADSDPALEA